MEVNHLFWHGFVGGVAVTVAAGAIVLLAVMAYFDSDFKEFGP